MTSGSSDAYIVYNNFSFSCSVARAHRWAAAVQNGAHRHTTTPGKKDPKYTE